MSWPDVVLPGELEADYSQIELHLGDGGHVTGLNGVGLAFSEAEDNAVLVAARQFGAVAVQVQVVAAEPAPDPVWDAAVEFSVRTGEGVCVTGWAGGGSIAVRVPSGVDARVRYVVLTGQLAQDQGTQGEGGGPDRYLVQIWPAPTAPGRVVASTSPWSQYWTFGQAASDLLAELVDVPDPDRLLQVIDRALADHPDVAERVRAGDQRYRLGIIRYVQHLFDTTHLSPAYSDIRDDHDRLGRLIDARSALQNN